MSLFMWCWGHTQWVWIILTSVAYSKVGHVDSFIEKKKNKLLKLLNHTGMGSISFLLNLVWAILFNWNYFQVSVKVTLMQDKYRSAQKTEQQQDLKLRTWLWRTTKTVPINRLLIPVGFWQHKLLFNVFYCTK